MTKRIVIMNGSKLTEIWQAGTWLVVKVEAATGAATGIFPHH